MYTMSGGCDRMLIMVYEIAHRSVPDTLPIYLVNFCFTGRPISQFSYVLQYERTLTDDVAT